MSIGDFFKKLFGWIKGFAIRSGLDQFIKDHWDDALRILIEEARKHPGVPFGEWKSIVRDALKRLTGTDKDNWLEILVALVFETAKAKRLV
jgi:hypothetical protein